MPEIELKAESFDSKFTEFSAHYRIFATRDKLIHASKSFFIYFLIAIVCVFIPFLHFFLTPGFFIFAVYKFIQAFKILGVFAEINFSCPSCRKEFKAKNIFFQFPQKLFCKECGTNFRLLQR